ncbi:peroxidase mlt-7-like [Diadema setosum]|uniref:peroxidase mlt-7-like n=1 Tax=Diadema setosum TaxID=31175 RepID=UPI003B3BE0B6
MKQSVQWLTVGTSLAILVAFMLPCIIAQPNIEKRSLARDENYYPEDELLADGAEKWRPQPLDLLMQFKARKKREAAILQSSAQLQEVHEDSDVMEEEGGRVRRQASSSSSSSEEGNSNNILISLQNGEVPDSLSDIDFEGMSKREIRRVKKEFRRQKRLQRQRLRQLRRQARQRRKQEREETKRIRQEFKDGIDKSEVARLARIINMEVDTKASMAKMCEESHHHHHHHGNEPEKCGNDEKQRKYRHVNGTCNNLNHRTWGSGLETLKRLLPAEFHGEGLWIPRDFQLSTRKVSDIVFQEDVDDDGAHDELSILIMHWGQFTDHDIAHTPAVTNECDCHNLNASCYPLQIPKGDNVFKSTECFKIPRSMPDCRTPSKREQFNEITAFIDASNIYGSTDAEMNHLRFHSTTGMGYNNLTVGRLRCLELPRGQDKKPLLPHQELGECFNENDKTGVVCGEAGDFRANEQPGLTSLHTIFVREHNFIAGKLVEVNPHWATDNERVFQEARKIVGAIMQRIDYEEYLPTIFGRKGFQKHIGEYKGYQKNVDPSITNVFATAGYRQGHSAVDQVLERYNRTEDGSLQELEPLNLDAAFFNAKFMYDFEKGGIDGFIEGMVRQKARKIDLRVVKALQKRLFVGPDDAEDVGLDVMAINLLRGRDHGIAPYFKWREYCTSDKFKTWKDLKGVMSSETIDNLKKAYGYTNEDMKRIDPFVGFLGELPEEGSLFGPTLGCILGRQFKALRDGDRFFYLNDKGAQAFTADQRKAIDQITMARVFCDTMDNPLVFQKNVFKIPHGDSNPSQLCRDLPPVNLQAWCEY